MSQNPINRVRLQSKFVSWHQKMLRIKNQTPQNQTQIAKRKLKGANQILLAKRTLLKRRQTANRKKTQTRNLKTVRRTHLKTERLTLDPTRKRTHRTRTKNRPKITTQNPMNKRTTKETTESLAANSRRAVSKKRTTAGARKAHNPTNRAASPVIQAIAKRVVNLREATVQAHNQSQPRIRRNPHPQMEAQTKARGATQEMRAQNNRSNQAQTQVKEKRVSPSVTHLHRHQTKIMA